MIRCNWPGSFLSLKREATLSPAERNAGPAPQAKSGEEAATPVTG